MSRLRGVRSHGLWTRALISPGFTEHVLLSLVATEAFRLASTSSWLRGALFETRKLQQTVAALEEARLLLRWEGGEHLLGSCSLPTLAEYVGCFTAFYWYITAVMGKSDASARSYSRCLAGLCSRGNRSLEHVATHEFHAYVRRLPRNSASGSLLSATVRHFIEFRRLQGGGRGGSIIHKQKRQSWPGIAGMNIFRLCGDMLHLLSIMLLVFKLHKSKSCVGVSCRMQEMYAMVFVFRYLDLFWSFISVYNTVMKLIFITTTIYLIYLMRVKPPISQTYERSNDSFQYELYVLGPAFLLGIICTEEYTIPDVLWSTSIWLESVAILPQLILLQQIREVENLTSDFVGCMGAYRAFYILNWVYRYFAEDYVNWIGWIGGLVQTGLYCDFFYFYAKSKWYGNKLVLPVAA